MHEQHLGDLCVFLSALGVKNSSNAEAAETDAEIAEI